LATQNPDMFGTTHKYYPARAWGFNTLLIP
jgi:hypothetical protein